MAREPSSELSDLGVNRVHHLEGEIMRAIAITALTCPAIAALSLLPACGGSDASSICGATADSGALTVNAPEYTCGSVAFDATNQYVFTAAAAAQHTVSVVSTSGNANLCTPARQVSPPSPRIPPAGPGARAARRDDSDPVPVPALSRAGRGSDAGNGLPESRTFLARFRELVGGPKAVAQT
jgi:hypothetical protein